MGPPPPAAGSGATVQIVVDEHYIVTIKPADTTIAPPVAVDHIQFTSYKKGKVVGGWDVHSKNYLISMQDNTSFC